MSVTRLAEQGFNTQLKDTPAITHSKGFNSTLKQREGLYFLPVTLVVLPINMRLEVNQTAEGTTARVAPVTLTPTGMETLRNKNDLWTFNSQGFLVRVHRTQRKALFMPDSRCPVPTERLENYSRTVTQRPNNNTEVIEEAYQDLDKKQQKRVIQGHNWIGETWFKVKRGTPLPGNIPPQPALPPARGPTPATSRQLTADETQAPLYRHNVKKPLTEVRPTGQARTSTPTHQTAIPHPKEVSPTQDYWIKDGPYWKCVHVQPRRDMYIPQQTDDGPDVTKLTTWRQTMVKPTSGNRGYRIDDGRTIKRKATLDIEWTGSTNFEENTAYKDEFITDDPEERQEAKRATGAPTPQQSIEQERREHELTHLPYRSWCPTCLQSKGRQDYHPKQTSKTAVTQVDLMYYKALEEKQTTSVLTAVDVETGMCMAVQLEDKTRHVQYLSTCLQQFFMECGRTHAILNNTVLQSDQEDFIISLIKMMATAMGGNIAVRQSPAYTSQAQGSVERFHRTLMGQVRAIKLQLENKYGIKLNSKHPIMPWLVKHSAYLLNRYSIHSDGNTSYYRRWGKKHKHIDTANNSRPTETETLTQVHQGNSTLQAVRETNNQNTNSWSNTRHSGLCRQWLGRMRHNEKVDNRLSDQSLWSNNPLRQQNTANNCAEQRGSRTIRDQHRSNRSPTHQKPPERSSQHEEDQHLHPHRLVKREEHGNKNWIIKEGQTHRAQTPVYTTAGRTWPCEDCQDQHRQQPGRHLHQVRCNRDASASHHWWWDQHPSSLSFQTTTSNRFTAASALMCERVHTVRTTCVACTHRHTLLLSHGVNKGWQHEVPHSDLLYFNMGYINMKCFATYVFNMIGPKHDWGRLGQHSKFLNSIRVGGQHFCWQQWKCQHVLLWPSDVRHMGPHGTNLFSRQVQQRRLLLCSSMQQRCTCRVTTGKLFPSEFHSQHDSTESSLGMRCEQSLQQRLQDGNTASGWSRIQIGPVNRWSLNTPAMASCHYQCGWQHSGNSGQQSIILGQWFSVALQHANSCDAGHRDSTSVVSSVGKQPYSGTSVLSTMPTEVQQRVEQLLMDRHPLLEHGFQLRYHGSKTKERLRGNKSILEWVNVSTNMNAFVDAFNKYHSDQHDDVDEQ